MAKLIVDRRSHDSTVDRARAGQPTVLFVSHAPMPACAAFRPKFEALARQHDDKAFAIVEMTPEITPLIKFGVQQCPILILMRGGRCETILGGDVKALEKRLETL